MRFRTTILSGGGTTAGIQIPNEVLDALGPSRKPPVNVTINGFSYRSTVATVSGAYMVGVTNEFRKESGLAAGDEVDVDIELDTEKREVTVPPDLAAALEGDAAARRSFDGLSYSKKRSIVEPIADAKTPETRQRRLDKSVERLREGKL